VDPSELATFHVTETKDGASWTGSYRYKNGQGGTTKGTRPVPHPSVTISGKLVTTSCTGHVCKTTVPVAGARVIASGTHGTGSATSGPKGTYAITVPPGTYTVTPSLAGSTFVPPSTRIVAKVDHPNVNFRAKSPCDEEGTSARDAGIAAASSDNPCQRLYTFRILAWIPQSAVVDPAVGSNQQNGADYPEDALSLLRTLSLHLFGSDAYPPCLAPSVLDIYKSARLDMTWRAKWLGSGPLGSDQQNVVDPGLGAVTVPIAWNGETGTLALRSPSVTPGAMVREYDYLSGNTAKSCVTPPRPLVPVVNASLLSTHSFEIDASWPIPFQPYEDVGDIQSFNDQLIKPLTKEAEAKLDKKLALIPGYSKLPPYVQGKLKEYGVWAAENLGAAGAIALVKDAVKHGGDFLTNLTPPPVKYGAKAVGILRKLAYGAADIKILGTFTTAHGSTSLAVTIQSDLFPSFGLRISRPQGLLPWSSSNSVTVTQSNFTWDYGALPDVVNDAISKTGATQSLQGGAAAKGAITNALAILRNAVPQFAQAFLPPILLGFDNNLRRLDYFFPGQHS